jgi:hypothetical protein
MEFQIMEIKLDRIKILNVVFDFVNQAVIVDFVLGRSGSGKGVDFNPVLQQRASLSLNDLLSRPVEKSVGSQNLVLGDILLDLIRNELIKVLQ